MRRIVKPPVFMSVYGRRPDHWLGLIVEDCKRLLHSSFIVLHPSMESLSPAIRHFSVEVKENLLKCLEQ